MVRGGEAALIRVDKENTATRWYPIALVAIMLLALAAGIWINCRLRGAATRHNWLVHFFCAARERFGCNHAEEKLVNRPMQSEPQSNQIPWELWSFNGGSIALRSS